MLQAPITDNGRIEYVAFDTDTLSITIPSPNRNQTVEQQVKPPLEEAPAADTFTFPMSVVSTIWICGVVVMLVFNIAQLIRLRRKLIGATPLRKNIYLADHIQTPFVMGLIRPKIYLPSSMYDTEQSYIIQHEKHHIHRGDHIIKLFAFVAICVHWFNPLVWLAFALSSKDMEMSCDEAVIKRIDKDIRADYSSSLLHFSTGKKVIIGTPLAFGEGNTKERIENIMKYRKPTFIIVVLALILCVGLTACLSSNPQSDTEQPNLSEEATKTYSYEELSEMPAKELLDLFIQNGLVINDELKATYTEEELQDLFKERFEMWHIGMSAMSHTMYIDLAEQTKVIYDKIAE